MRRALAFLTALALAGCGGAKRDEPGAASGADAVAAETRQEPTPAARWDLLSSGEGVGLRLGGTGGMHLFCAAGTGRLLVNVPAFTPIGSEERLSFGSGGRVVALVADSRGDKLRGGVSGEGAVPAELGAILEGPISASYGRQVAGPFPPPSADDRRAFVTACAGKAADRPSPAPGKTAACFTQDGAALTMTRLRAIGTEPFWGARIEGRCVTYSTPDDQQGTRVWTKFTPGPDGGIWSGALGGRQFELRTRPAAPPGCSDGMSDNRYPHHVSLRVGGETRTGCAKPL